MNNKDDQDGEKFQGFDLSRFLKAVFLVAVVAVLLVFGVYIYIFNGPLSGEQELWGTFGDYIGGTLNPILSFLALLALLVTIAIQSKQLFLSRRELQLTKIELTKTSEAAQRQAKHFEKEAKRADIYRIIEQLSSRINTNYNENRIDSAPNKSAPLSVHSALKKGDNLEENKELKWLYENYQNTNSETYRTIQWLLNDLERLAHYITAYEEATESTFMSTPFPEFYKGEFGFMVLVFHKLNMAKRFLFDFYCD